MKKLSAVFWLAMEWHWALIVAGTCGAFVAASVSIGTPMGVVIALLWASTSYSAYRQGRRLGEAAGARSWRHILEVERYVREEMWERLGVEARDEMCSDVFPEARQRLDDVKEELLL